MATKQAQMTREKTWRSFLKIDSMQTSTNTARKMASAVGTVMTNATWSSTFWEEIAGKTQKTDLMCSKRKYKGKQCWWTIEWIYENDTSQEGMKQSIKSIFWEVPVLFVILNKSAQSNSFHHTIKIDSCCNFFCWWSGALQFPFVLFPPTLSSTCSMLCERCSVRFIKWKPKMPVKGKHPKKHPRVNPQQSWSRIHYGFVPAILQHSDLKFLMKISGVSPRCTEQAGGEKWAVCAACH